MANGTVDEGITLLKDVGGTAATGPSIGGPWGAAIGGGIGLAEFLIGMSQRKKAE